MGIRDPETVATALELGYRHLDTAQIYGNEAVVGDGLAAADAPREEVFLATKVWADSLARDDAIETTRASLGRLDVDAVDLLYVHRPVGAYDPEETLAAFDRLRGEGTVRHVGVSNFSVDQLDEARSVLDSPLFAHQTEYHPLFRRPELVEHARRHGYYLVAYSPLAGGKVFDVPVLSAIAEKHGADEAAVSLAWLLGKENVVVIPKASGEAHLRANLTARELELDDGDAAAIESIDREVELFPD
ncbi:aldo/keto reductase [Halegenticoccus soli]|uniref:aldo/keto reductase n=1 Tax=Halegenticoccus soli TaxID=1985678 RepID=UPI000C6D0F6F|nr:aldo/keto reductase [Halegenticoccus soli]